MLKLHIQSSRASEELLTNSCIAAYVLSKQLVGFNCLVAVKILITQSRLDVLTHP